MGRFPQLFGFGIGALPSLVTGSLTVERLFLTQRANPSDRVMDWALFVLGSLVLPGLISASLEKRYPQIARGVGAALVLLACPLNILILIGLLGTH